MLGTMPPHLCYIFLQSPQPISRFPSRLMVPIQRALQLKVTKWGALVNWAFYGGPVSENFDEVSAKAFFANGRTLDISRLTMENLDMVEQQMRNCLSGNGTRATSVDSSVHLYVCTHGTRDCRCGTTGKDVADALRREISARAEADPKGLASCFTVGEVGHVGGHQYAANLLVYPHGEWLGSLTPEHIPTTVDKVIELASNPFSLHSLPLLPLNWRGRMGLSKEVQ
ncbi:Sucrase/ferredoxin-like-domain-containing protein, partial [Armillaria mellea]